MRAQDSKYNETRIVKIPLEEFIASLMSVYTSGIRFVDLIVTRDALQDQVTIVVREDVPAEKKLTENDINDLLRTI